MSIIATELPFLLEYRINIVVNEEALRTNLHFCLTYWNINRRIYWLIQADTFLYYDEFDLATGERFVVLYIDSKQTEEKTFLCFPLATMSSEHTR